MVNGKRYAIRKFPSGTLNSFFVKIDKGEGLENEWHYHSALELILLRGSSGKVMLGNRTFGFGRDEVLLIGSNVPHFFMHDSFMDCGLDEAAEAWVVQFEEGFLGEKFMSLPEAKPLHHLFRVSQSGLRVAPQAREKVIALMEQLLNAADLSRIVLLLAILNLLVDGNAGELVSESGTAPVAAGVRDTRLEKILEHTHQYYGENIKLDDVAAIINLTKESFCRFFKSHTGKTYLEYLIEYRISQACRLLRESDMSAKEIGFCIGYENLSHFYTHFRRIVSMSPMDYRHRSLAPVG